MMLPTLPQPACTGCTLDGKIGSVAGDDQNSGVSGAMAPWLVNRSFPRCHRGLSLPVTDMHTHIHGPGCLKEGLRLNADT